MMVSQTRRDAVGAALEGIIRLNRALRAARKAPFHEVRLSPSQMDALFLIAHHPSGPVTPGALAESLGVTRGAVTQLVDGLVARGLVTQIPNPADARSRVVILEREAADEVARFEAEVIDDISPMFHGLTDTEVTTLATLLARVNTAAGAAPSAAPLRRRNT
jgi:DNA-binding MarR family transcriptional regulator